MTNIEEAYQLTLKVEEKLNKIFEGNRKGKAQGNTGGVKSFGSRNEDWNKNDEASKAKIKRVIIFITPTIKTMVNNEKEEEEGLDKGLREEVLKEPICNVEKNGIKPLNVYNTKGQKIEEMMAMHELRM